MVNFDQEGQQGLKRSPTVERHRGSDGEDEFEIGNPFNHPEKKRRLTPEQVRFLERSFEKENKLEPERKVQLAQELGLQPRQVAIWFQNRRARYKTKQLEKEYDSLKASYDQLKADYDSLIKEREGLQNEVKLLTKKLKLRETGQGELNPEPQQPFGKPKSETEKLPTMGVGLTPPTSTTKQTEDASSAKSDVLDSESPHCTEANQSSRPEDPVDSTHILDPELQSDFSQDDDQDPQLMSLLPSTPTYNNFLRVDQECYDPNVTACNFSLVDDQPFWSWLY
ncbi:hypothetical protein Cgig2_031240 [Carnegiea gigantea]|uniref:Homeobox-leucine zipper protein n=1 Tax=Carnegiea gigantea TaxID=171969 RepID=A0A9Q1KMP2_9CARY|nr:hypothetical protein Cgig2_031240 [Carnegiea gigantea]